MDVMSEDNCKNAYKCSDCDRVFSRKVQYQKHILQHVVPMPEVDSVCGVCGKIFKNETALSRHTNKHKTKNTISCVICGKKFCRRSSLKLHVRIHTQSNKYECEKCGKCFSSGIDLKKHCSTCNDEKPFSCNICHERFTWRDQVNSHYCVPKHENKVEAEDLQNANSITTRNIDLYQVSDDKSVNCGICQRHFSQKGHLILHYRRTHNRELLIEKL